MLIGAVGVPSYQTRLDLRRAESKLFSVELDPNLFQEWEAHVIREIDPEDVLGPLNDAERKNAPRRLYVSGDHSLLESGRRVSVVGSRKPTEDGRKRTRSFVGSLVERGMIVVSGLAEGIDAEAHRTTIARSGRTIAMLGTGLDQFFPTENRGLQQRIMDEHLAVSQFPAGTPGRKGNFPMRNRTMALISDATVIVEAGDGSGTLHQGWEALRLGRLLFLMKSLTERSDLTWPAEMMRYGAQVLDRDNLENVLLSIPERFKGEVAF